jgi:hypothetical protein
MAVPCGDPACKQCAPQRDAQHLRKRNERAAQRDAAAYERDAEIARLRAALAAGPAALRVEAEVAHRRRDDMPGVWMLAARLVEEAQRRALRET